MSIQTPEEYDAAWMEQEERYYTDVGYGESRIAPWWTVVEPNLSLLTITKKVESDV